MLTLGSYGCNLRCPFCQNADIACAGAEDAAWRYVAPEEAVGLALRARDRGCVGVAYTYNEPLVGYEYVRDVGRLASEAGLANVLVSNGMVNEEPLTELLGIVDAANIDLKGFTQGFYDTAGGSTTIPTKSMRQRLGWHRSIPPSRTISRASSRAIGCSTGLQPPCPRSMRWRMWRVAT